MKGAHQWSIGRTWVVLHTAIDVEVLTTLFLVVGGVAYLERPGFTSFELFPGAEPGSSWLEAESCC